MSYRFLFNPSQIKIKHQLPVPFPRNWHGPISYYTTKFSTRQLARRQTFAAKFFCPIKWPFLDEVFYPATGQKIDTKFVSTRKLLLESKVKSDIQDSLYLFSALAVIPKISGEIVAVNTITLVLKGSIWRTLKP